MLNEQMNQSGFVSGRPLNMSGEKRTLHFMASTWHVAAAAPQSAGPVLHQDLCSSPRDSAWLATQNHKAQQYSETNQTFYISVAEEQEILKFRFLQNPKFKQATLA